MSLSVTPTFAVAGPQARARSRCRPPLPHACRRACTDAPVVLACTQEPDVVVCGMLHTLTGTVFEGDRTRPNGSHVSEWRLIVRERNVT